MESKIKATGEIVHVGDYNTIHHDPMYKNERTGPWRLEELDFTETPDYWTHLEHQYAGMAMQAMLTSQELMQVVTGAEKLLTKGYAEKVAIIADKYAHALVEKMKEERK